MGILIISANNITIKNNYLHTHGVYTYGIGATHSNNLKIINNTIKATPSSEGTTHVPILLGDCHNNIISYNNLDIIVQTPYNKYISLNGIYFSVYGTPLIDGGICNNNIISHNTIKGYDSVWCYTIQMMGNNNLAINNTVSGGSIGISSSGTNNQIINNTIHATATGISAGTQNKIIGNIINLNDNAIGISASSNNCTIKNNTITTTNRPGISVSSSNNLIENNIITTQTGYGISIEQTSTNNNISNNTIDTQSTGIFFKQQSIKNKPTNNTLISNNIDTTSDYAIDAYESENTIFIKNHLMSAKGNGNNAIRFSKTSSGGTSQLPQKTCYLNDTEYSKYFNEDGSLKNSSIQYTFNLNGPLYNKNITLSVPTTINGNQNTIYNGTIKILGDGSETTIKNLKIINKNQNGIILDNIESTNIENNIIIVNQTIESYGIYLHGSYYNRILNNTITSYGDYVNFGIFLYSSNNNKIRKNNVNTISSDIEIPYQDRGVMLNEKIGIIPQIYTTYGILAVYSSKNEINENKVNLTSLFKEPKNVTENCSNSMVGIDIYYDSHYNTVNNNQINVIGNNPYSYGMGVLGSEKPTGELLETAKENKFENNNVTVFGNYFATGFIAGLGSVDTIIKNNILIVKSNTFTYGVTFEASQRSTLTSNKINLNSPVIYGIELFDSNKNTIEGNSINATGYYKYAIAGSSSSENKIINNNITTKSTNIIPTINETAHSDHIRFGDTGILLIDNSSYNTIKSNLIIVDSEYTINLTNSENNTITENSLVSLEEASQSIFSNSTNIIINNEGHRLSIYTDDIISNPGTEITLKAIVKSTSGNSDGLKVTFTIGLTVIGTSTTKDGIAELTYKIPNKWRCTYYNLIASVSGEGYITKTITKTLELKELKDNNQNTETPPSEEKTENNNPIEEPNPQVIEKPKIQTNNNEITITPTKSSKTVSKKSKKLVLSTTLKIGKKIAKKKKLIYIINGKKYTTKTNNKGVAKIILKKSVLKKLLKKAKVGKKIKYKIKYGKKTYTQYIKVKK